jgi:hypothetical protein
MPLPLAIATGGMRDTSLRLSNFTWGSFKDRLRKPQIGGKDGSYYIRGSELRQPRRTDENLLSAKTIILDGDSSIDPETGEIKSGAPKLEEVAGALKEMGITFCAHTSHSFIPDELWKYRIIIPADIPNQEYLDASVNWLISQLHSRGIWLADVTENHRWSQPWYSSRVRDREALKDFLFVEHEAGSFPILDAMDAYRLSVKQQEKEDQVRRLQPVSVVAEGNIQTFNKSFSLNDARSLLESAGYRFGYYEKGKDTYRFMRPGSETQTYGVVLFKGAMGDWCTYSHHGSADLLSSRVCDPFELVATLKYSGDLKACARSIFPKEKSLIEKLSERSRISPPPLQNDDFQNFPEKSVIENRRTFSEPELSAPQGGERAPKKRVSLIPWAELRDEPVRWLVPDLIPAKSFGSIYARPSSYKSFLALHIAAMVSTGREVWGRPCAQSAVIYVAAEGAGGMWKRMAAIKQAHGINEAPIFFVRSQLNLATSLEDRDALVHEIMALNVNPGLIILDTFARVTAGIDENSAQGVGAAIAVQSSLMDTGAAVMIVHHQGKNSEAGQRGSSALLAACDFELKCEKTEELQGRVTVTKQKDGEMGMVLGFKMSVESLSQLDPSSTSLAMHPCDESEVTSAVPNRTKIGKDAATAFAAFETAISEGGGTVPPIGERAPKGTKAITESLWRGYWRKITTKTGGAERMAFSRAKDQLIEARKVDHWGEFYWQIKETAQSETGPFPHRVVSTSDEIPF